MSKKDDEIYTKIKPLLKEMSLKELNSLSNIMEKLIELKEKEECVHGKIYFHNGVRHRCSDCRKYIKIELHENQEIVGQ